jgi:hypothetical protein
MIAAEDEGKPDVLDECNKLFNHPKAKEQQQMLTDKADNNGLPRFGDAVLRLAGILRRDVVFVVDAVDLMPQDDQSGLFDAFRDVMDRSIETHEPKITVRVLATCRTNKTFANRAFITGSTINIEEGNSKDMALQLSSDIGSMTDWTTDECLEAEKKSLGHGRTSVWLHFGGCGSVSS